MSVPADQKLWNMLVLRAKAKFPKWPSLPASKWVHQEYVKHGGRFVSEASMSRVKRASDKMRTANKHRGKDDEK